MQTSAHHMGSSPKWGPILVPLNMRCRNIIYTQKGAIILRTTHMQTMVCSFLNIPQQVLQLHYGFRVQGLGLSSQRRQTVVSELWREALKIWNARDELQRLSCLRVFTVQMLRILATCRKPKHQKLQEKLFTREAELDFFRLHTCMPALLVLRHPPLLPSPEPYPNPQGMLFLKLQSEGVRVGLWSFKGRSRDMGLIGFGVYSLGTRVSPNGGYPAPLRKSGD